jgi:hypothetical protein
VKSKKEPRSEKVTIRLTAAQKEELLSRSTAQRRDLSDYIRLLIEEDLAHPAQSERKP